MRLLPNRDHELTHTMCRTQFSRETKWEVVILMSPDAKSAWSQIQKKLSNPIDSKSLLKLSQSIDEKSMKDPSALRKLIKNVASTAKLSVSEQTIDELVHTVQSKKIGFSQIQQLLRKFR